MLKMKFFIAVTCLSLVLFLNVMVHGQRDAMDNNNNVHALLSDIKNEMDTREHGIAKRAVDLRTLRQLMNNIAFSEYYRLRGLELLGNLGMGHGRPGGLPANHAGTTQQNSLLSLSVPNHALLQALASTQMANLAAQQQASASSPVASIVAAPDILSTSSSTIIPSGAGTRSDKNGMFSFPLRSDEFHRFFGTLARSRSSRRG